MASVRAICCAYATASGAADAPSAPLQRYVAPADVDAVVVTHAHGDHWADLVDLGYLRTLPDAGPLPPLPVHGPANLRTVIRENLTVYAVTATSPGERRVGPFDLRFAAVEHIEHSHAVRVDDAELLAEAAQYASCPVVLATPGLTLETARPPR